MFPATCKFLKPLLAWLTAKQVIRIKIIQINDFVNDTASQFTIELQEFLTFVQTICEKHLIIRQMDPRQPSVYRPSKWISFIINKLPHT